MAGPRAGEPLHREHDGDRGELSGPLPRFGRGREPGLGSRKRLGVRQGTDERQGELDATTHQQAGELLEQRRRDGHGRGEVGGTQGRKAGQSKP